MIRLFYSYAHEDERLRDELQKHLSTLKREGAISDWHDRRIGPGQTWDPEIERELESAGIIVLLLSADFLASNYCRKEVEIALRRQAAGEARVIPVVLRPCDWSGPLRDLQALPRDGRPVTSWPDHDAAFLDVAQGIRRAAADLRGERPAEEPASASHSTSAASARRVWQHPAIIAAVIGALATVAAAVVGLFDGPGSRVEDPKPEVYRIRATVIENGSPADDATVWSSLGGEPKQVVGGWQFDIPAGNVPADRRVTFHAKRESAFLLGKTAHRLTDDPHQAVEIELERDRSAGLAGRVEDDAGRGLAGARVTAGDAATVTEADGRFRLEPRWADGETVAVSVERVGYLPVRRRHMAGNRAADEMTIALTPEP